MDLANCHQEHSHVARCRVEKPHPVETVEESEEATDCHEQVEFNIWDYLEFVAIVHADHNVENDLRTVAVVEYVSEVIPSRFEQLYDFKSAKVE